MLRKGVICEISEFSLYHKIFISVYYTNTYVFHMFIVFNKSHHTSFDLIVWFIDWSKFVYGAIHISLYTLELVCAFNKKEKSQLHNLRTTSY
jgi:hypothetical protein